MNKTLKKMLTQIIKSNNSDLHLTDGQKPFCRAEGELFEMANFDIVDNVLSFMEGVIAPARLAVFEDIGDLDFSMTFDSVRFRGHLYMQSGKVSAALRKLENSFKSFTELGLPESFSQLANIRDGLILVTGATGSGKSTTLASIINEINKTQARHILTIEDPIEYVHENIKSLVHQREIFTDVPDYYSAVKASLREDPDVVLIGEMRDVDTMRAAIRIAETGHLVLSTLHTSSACSTLERIIGSFPSEEQDSIIHQLTLTLRMIVTQRLLKSQLGNFRIPAVEILKVNQAVSNIMRQRKSSQIYAVMENSKAIGMQTIEQDLLRLVASGHITSESALAHCEYPMLLERMLQSSNLGVRYE